MDVWSGAQWLILFVIVTRAALGLAVAFDAIVWPQHQPTTRAGKVGRYIGRRIWDAGLIAVLIWGGFF